MDFRLFRLVGWDRYSRGRIVLDGKCIWSVVLLLVDRYLIVGNCLSVNSRHFSVLIGRYIIVGNLSSVMLGRYLEFDNLLSVFCWHLSVMFAEGLWVGWIGRIGIWSAGWLLVGKCLEIDKSLSVVLGIVGCEFGTGTVGVFGAVSVTFNCTWFAGESDGGGIGSAVFASDCLVGW